MGLTLTGPAGTVPIRLELARGYTRRLRNLAHDVLDDEYPVIVLAPATSRAGTLRLLVDDEAAAIAADELLASGTILQLVDDDVPRIRFVPVDVASITVDARTGTRRIVEVPYRELRP